MTTMLLEYLVPSRARREVLKALCSNPRGLTVRDLSRKAGVSYSNAHREVVQMKRLGLLRTEPVGHSLLCSLDPESPAAHRLTALLAASGRGGPDHPGEDSLYGNLKRWGAPLHRTGAPGKPLSLEETLAYGLRLARRDPDVAQVWPIVVGKNRAGLNLDELEFLARRLGQKRVLGFLLDLTGVLLKDAALRSLAKRLRDQRVSRTEDFFLVQRGERARRLAGKNTPPLAREWSYRMNLTLESLQGHLNKFVAAP